MTGYSRAKLWRLLGVVVALTMMAACMPRMEEAAPVQTYGLSGGATPGTVVVRPGQTVYDVAQAEGIETRDLIEANNLQPPYQLETGQRLRIPVPRTYTVERGDTLYGISRRYGISMTQLARMNDLQDPYLIQVGEDLRLPAESPRGDGSQPTRLTETSEPSQGPSQPDSNRTVVASPAITVRPLDPIPQETAAETAAEIADAADPGAPQVADDGLPQSRDPLVIARLREEQGADSGIPRSRPEGPAALPLQRQLEAREAEAQAQSGLEAASPSGAESRDAAAATSDMAGGESAQDSSANGQDQQQEATAADPETAEPQPTARQPQRRADVVLSDPPPRSGDAFLWPVEGPILSSYGPMSDGLHNDGVNIGAPRGSPVRASENGIVVYAGSELRGFGNLLLVRHEDGWMTAYAHLDDFLVDRGDIVDRGQAIGTVGSTGAVDRPQLHFEIRRGSDAVDPKPHLDGPPQVTDASPQRRG